MRVAVTFPAEPVVELVVADVLEVDPVESL